MNTVETVSAIADPMERLIAAADLAHKADAQAERLRYKRDMAILTMLRPFANAVAPTNAARARLRELANAATISDAEYQEGLASNREQRRRDLEAAEVTVYPRDVYEMLGVSRNLVNRLLMRMPVEPLPEVQNAERVAKSAHAKIPGMKQVVTDAAAIRNETALLLMSGSTGRGQVPNADVARATGLTTARIAQLRESA